MRVDLSFKWRVPRSGFLSKEGPWFDRTSEPGFEELLVESDPTTGSRMYEPLAETGLFRDFADLRPGSDAIIAFANKFGSLGIRADYSTSKCEPDPYLWESGESLASWQIEIGQLKTAVTFLDRILRKDTEGLKRSMSYEQPSDLEQGRWLYKDRVVLPCAGMTPFGADDPRNAAIALLMGWINAKLAKHASIGLVFDDEREVAELTVKPITLIGVMWLQLAMSLERPTNYQQCRTCTSWFDATGRGRKAKQVFCSDRCKTADYKRRRAEAFKLADKKIDPKDIAEKTATTAATVRRWLKDRPGQREIK